MPREEEEEEEGEWGKITRLPRLPLRHRHRQALRAAEEMTSEVLVAGIGSAAVETATAHFPRMVYAPPSCRNRMDQFSRGM
jgi:hypothetical protein